MNYVGISSGFHDAAISVIDAGGNITFAAHSERYSKRKHDAELDAGLLKHASVYMGADYELNYYERPWLKWLRCLRTGQTLPPLQVLNKQFPDRKIHTHAHHLSHAAAQFQTSPYAEATIVIIDAIGEFDTATIWHAHYDLRGQAQYQRLWHQTYPDSIGLFYTAMTQRVGLKPLDEEYILMGMAAYGSNRLEDTMIQDHIGNMDRTEFKENLHVKLDNYLPQADIFDIAAATQRITEKLIKAVIQRAHALSPSKNLCYGGGVALNCSANRLLGKYYDNIWIMPNPGDAGSSLGAAALGYGGRVNWTTAYLGYNIPGAYPVDAVVKHLLTDKIVGVASGRAEFGPRALGNRSLLADPRGSEIKAKVNEIKRRQQFRPFAPVVLEEVADMYFDMPRGFETSRYMQTVARCRHPDLFPAVIHKDGTSRVQTVPKDNSGIRQLLEQWNKSTGCPILLNTSLNIRGEPMVNDLGDARRFSQLYKIPVLS